MSTSSTGPQPLRLISRECIADTLTPITAFRALLGSEPAVLLESVEGRDRIARYSFIGLDPITTATFSATADMLGNIRRFIDAHAVESHPHLPYSGGVVTVFAYDAARAIEPLGTRPPRDVDFPDAFCLLPGTWIVFDHFNHSLLLLGLAAPGEETATAARLDAYRDRIFAANASEPAPVSPRGAMHASMSHDEFLERVARAKHYIFEGDLYQVQCGIRFDVEIDGEPFDFYRRIRARNPSPYMFYVQLPAGAVFGASPEFLVRLDGRAASLRPLAGTRSRGATRALDIQIADELLRDEKERAEHVMLVDLGRNDLGHVAEVGSVAVNELMVIERYSHVMHIVSNVTSTLHARNDALDLFAAAFPAGTVTGAPKVRAMQRIDELEPVARGFYAGSIAHFDFNGNMDSCITLRSVQVSSGRAYWQASAGIVADSVPEAEYAEVFHKTAIIRSILGIETPVLSSDGLA